MYEITDFFPRQKLIPVDEHPSRQLEKIDSDTRPFFSDHPEFDDIKYTRNYTHYTEKDRQVNMERLKNAAEKNGIFIYAEGKTLAQVKLELAKEEKCFVVTMNGINSSREDIFNNMRYESKLAGDRFVIGVSNPTLGITPDLVECRRCKAGQWNEATADLDAVLRGIGKNRPQALILLHSHSGATIHSYNVLKDLPSEIRDRIRYVGASPAHHVPEEIAFKPRNIISSKDGCVDIKFITKDKRNQVIPSIVKGNRDHDFDTPTLHAAKKEQTNLDIQESNQ